MRFWLPISLVAIAGIIISAAVALRIYQQQVTVESGALERAVDAHASFVQERLTERELLARMAAAMFTPPAAIEGDSLRALRLPFQSLKVDFLAVGWIPRVEVTQIDDALKALADNGVATPQFFGPGLKPIDPKTIDRPFYPVIDIEPRTPDNLKVLGVNADAIPQLAAVIEGASNNGQPLATEPRPLLQMPDTLGFVLYTPVYRADRALAGFVTFAYRLDEMLTHGGDAPQIAVAFVDPASNGTRSLITRDASGRIIGPTAVDPHNAYARELTFGQRRWRLAYEPARPLRNRALLLAVNAAAIGLALTIIIVGLFGYVIHNNLRLSREITSRISVEERLSAVIRELNHRVKNMLAVVQSIVMRSLRSGTLVDDARDLVIGRLHAMSHAVSLLTETEWQGISIRDLFSSQVLPATARIASDGPDIIIGSRAAQAMSLLFYELASNAGKHGALSVPEGAVTVSWGVEGAGSNAVFRLQWQESGGPPAMESAHSGFGNIVLDRVAPEAIRGTAKKTFGPNGFRYELIAPVWGLGDKGRAE